MKTVGRVEYDREEKVWRITCEPHVAMKLKRVFAQLKKGHVGTQTLSDTPTNARELEWFLERYPMEVTDRERLTHRAREQRIAEELSLSILSGKGMLRSFELALPPRDYQRQAAELALATGGLLLADDLGLGKTASAITMLSQAETRPALVVTMTHLTRQWQAELGRFAPSLRTHVLRSTKPYDLEKKCRHRVRPDPKAPGLGRCTTCGASRDDIHHGRTGAIDVVITNYHKLAGWGDALAGWAKTVIFDEAQELRSGLARETPAKYLAAKGIANRALFRCGLTATPIYNYGAEIFSVMNVLRPDALGTFNEFSTEWCEGGSQDASKARLADPKAFGTFARNGALMLRRTRADVGRELPDLSKVVQMVDSDTDALDQVSESCAELARIILAQGETHRGQKLSASEELSNKLRQATGIAKAPYVAAFVRMLVESGEKVVLWGWHREVYSIWLDKLKDLEPVMFTGSESAAQKVAARDAFISGKSNLLIMSLRAGAGLDGLQDVCRTGVFGELDWSPGVHEQCGGRIHRDGQKEKTMLYFLVSDEGADPIMTDVLQLKRGQIEGLRDPNADEVAAVTIDPNHVKMLAEDYLKRKGVA